MSVFDDYAKIAMEQGLIEKVAYPNTDEYIKKFPESGRAGSDDLKTIEELYFSADDGIKLIEQSHPKMIVISPSYDRFNGVVENIVERQNIMADIALRGPNANLTKTRYVKAHKNLLENLVRVGFMLDNKNQVELMKVADSCADTLGKIAEEDLKKKANLTKEAFWPLLIGGIGALLSGLALFNNIDPADQGMVNNIINAINQLEEAKSSNPKILGPINTLIKGLNIFLVTAKTYQNTPELKVDNNTHELDQLLTIKNDPNEMNKIDIAKKYVDQCEVLQEHLPEFIGLLKDNKSTESNLPKGLDYAAKAWEYLWPKASVDAVHALNTLYSAISETLKTANHVTNEAVEKENDLKKQMEGKKNPAPTKAKDFTPEQQNHLAVDKEPESVDDFYSKLMS